MGSQRIARQAFMSAWKVACTCTDPSTVVVPGGTYVVGPVQFQGPCRAPMGFRVQGTLKAPTDLNRFELQDGWVIFQDIDSLIISGGGTFDGQGHTAWGQNNCARTGTCNLLLVNLCFTKVTNSIIQHNFPEQQAVSHGHFELLEHDSSVCHHQCNRG